MAKEHHCPNCGPQACNASTSKIHTCGVCATVWEEVLTEAPAVAAPAPPKPAPAPPAPKTPAAPAPAPAATSPAPSSPAPAVVVPVPAKAIPTAAPAATTSRPAPTPPSPVPGETPGDPRDKRLAEAVAAAKVKRCPACSSESLAAPSEVVHQGGRVVLADSQSYFGHRWYADTGELLPDASPPRPAPPPAPSPSA